MGEAWLWKCHWRGEERCERHSHRKCIVGGPEKRILWDGQIKRSKSLFLREGLLLCLLDWNERLQ
jgi:hypothetical protein